MQYKDAIALMLFAELKDPIQQKQQSQYGAEPHKVTPPNMKFKNGIDR